jgi:hypothetical protein
MLVGVDIWLPRDVSSELVAIVDRKLERIRKLILTIWELWPAAIPIRFHRAKIVQSAVKGIADSLHRLERQGFRRLLYQRANCWQRQRITIFAQKRLQLCRAMNAFSEEQFPRKVPMETHFLLLLMKYFMKVH